MKRRETGEYGKGETDRREKDMRGACVRVRVPVHWQTEDPPHVGEDLVDDCRISA